MKKHAFLSERAKSKSLSNLEEIARENSKSNLMQFQTTDNQQPSDCSVRNSRIIETTQESQKRRNDNRVNAQIAKAAGVSKTMEKTQPFMALQFRNNSHNNPNA